MAQHGRAEQSQADTSEGSREAQAHTSYVYKILNAVKYIMQHELIDEPKCKCGQTCVSYTYMTPNYDDGGSIDSFSPETIYLDQCADCNYNYEQYAATDDDELPF